MAVDIILALLVAAPSIRVAIVPIAGNDERDIRAVVRAVGEAVDGHVDLVPSSVDDVYSPDGGTLNEAVAACAGDALCVRGAVQTYGADLGLVVVLNRRIDPPMLQVELVPGRQSVGAARSKPTSLPPGETEVSVLVRLTNAILSDAGFTRAARIAVVPDPPDATIQLNGKERGGRGRQLFRVEPGDYRLAVTREGYEPFDAQRKLAAGDLWNVEATLEAVPEDRSILASPWFWVGTAGTVVVAAVVTGIVVASSSGGTDPVCIRNILPECSGSAQ